MIHVLRLLGGVEYKLHDAKFCEKKGLWIGEVVGKGVVIGVSARLIEIVYFFESAADYDAFQRDGKLKPGRPSGLLN